MFKAPPQFSLQDTRMRIYPGLTRPACPGELPPVTQSSRTESHATQIELVYFNAGGGHRAAATALKAQLSRQCPDWNVSLVDLFPVLDPRQWFKRTTGFAPEAYYNKRLSSGFTLGLAQELKLLQAMIRMAHRQLVGRLLAHWRETMPTMVVSLVPNFNRPIADSLKQFGSAAPFVTLMTDMADYPPRFWVEPGYTQHLICGTEYAASQAIACGADPRQVYCTSGMVLSPKFYDAPMHDRLAGRQALGFEPGDVVGLVMFGGHGSAAMKRIAKALPDRPLILMCGRNEALKEALSGLPSRATHHVVGFTDDVAHWMRLADYFIGKPGPGSISEALHCGLPVIVTRNAWTMPQERWNTDWILERGVGLVLPSMNKIDVAVQEVLLRFDELRVNVSQLRNQALFEVPRLLEQILGKHSFVMQQ